MSDVDLTPPVPENHVPLTKAEPKTDAKAAKSTEKHAAEPTKVKFGEFKAAELAAEYRNLDNENHAKRIDELLQTQLQTIFPNLKAIPKGGEFSKGGERTLQITPTIEKIKIVSTTSRVLIGGAQGKSDIVMHVDYRDSSTGETIAHPDFGRGNKASSGGWSYGVTDKKIRSAVVAQIVDYTSTNR